MFHSIQGEGYWAGHNAFFIRLAGCDVACPWCDTKESWHTRHPVLNVAAILAEVRASLAPIAIITGGEPLMHNLDELTVTLQGEGIRTHLETSGAHPLSGDWDWITLSPKPHREPKGMVVKICDEVKVIIEGESDIEWAESFKEQASTRPGPGNCLGARHFYLQPEWLKKDSAIPLIVEHVLKNPQWQISLQTHKFLGIR